MPTEPPYTKFTSTIFNKDADTVTITRTPAFGNSLDFTCNRVFSDSGDFPVSFRDGTWPQYDSLKIDLFPLTTAQRNALEIFIVTHAGELINLTILNITYVGVVQDPKLETIDEHNTDCSHRVSFVFETRVCV